MRVGLPARHVRARRADAADPAPRRARARGRVAGRAERDRPQTAFWWRAPDGSTVRAEYLYGSYSNGRDIPVDPEQLVARARGYEAELGDAALPGGGMLLMNGSDHLLPQPWLGRVVAAANDDRRTTTASRSRRSASTSRDQPRRRARRPGAASCARARAPTCSWAWRRTASTCTRPRAARRAQPRARRRAARARCSSRPSDYPRALLDVGWRQLVLNSAHDSSCACSDDEVVEAVRVRYQEARHVGEALARDALRQLATTVDAPPSSTIVVNSTARTTAPAWSRVPLPGEGPVHLVALDDGTACPTQVVRTTRRRGDLHRRRRARRSGGCSR